MDRFHGCFGIYQQKQKKEKMFVANRIQFIRENTNLMQRFYVPTKENPADDSFRGLKNVHSEKAKSLFEGSGFLWTSESKGPTQISVDGSDPEGKATLIVNLATIECDLLSKLESKSSSWLRLRKSVEVIVQLNKILLM